MSFTAVISLTQAVLAADAGLCSLVDTLWPGRRLSVAVVYRHRTEVALEKLPIIQITRPSRKAGALGRVGAGGGDHALRLYAGFYQPDKALIVSELVLFEEAIEQTVLANVDLRRKLKGLELTQTVNDEGKNAPSAWTVMDFAMRYLPVEEEAEDYLPETVLAGTSPEIGTPHGDDYIEVTGEG